MTDVWLRRYEDGDGDALVALDEWALGEAGTDPEDVPGSDDLQSVEESYISAGGDFVVGTIPCKDAEMGKDGLLQVRDTYLIAMGGYLPTEVGYEDERSVTEAAELHRMRVAPTHQGRGYGRALLDELERRAVEAGFTLFVATTAARQERAVRFYPSAGYDEVDRSTYDEYELVHFEKRIHK